ncbi:hypothetical protein FIBSPDRAFT_862273 [Athelia psychrophila]|uniref:BTB domain-containing protein n=1 Tax=Athelia psychrophila TaxID=1759441 RepID=A0A166IGD8_9AGAM|nr:hypothetical protein FIBSPDRAFT_862273 [Fibularhizoctonia sp. CBS 109695]
MSSILTSAPPSPSLVALGSTRASSPLGSNDLDQPAVQVSIELEAKVTRHSEYYFKDGNVVFLIEETLYNVHRYFFERDSAHFRSILESVQGVDDKGTIVLADVSCSDFNEFLAILYPADFRRPTQKTTAQWTSVLHLAAKWGFESIRLLAIDNLAATAIPVDKIVLGRRYGISDWLPGAYETVCTRVDSLTVEEGMKLGVEDIIRIAAARQAYGCGKARYETRHLSEDVGDIFGLEKPLKEVSVGYTDIEDGAINILEDQVVAAQAELAAFPTPAGPPHLCLAPAESDEGRLKREDKEDKERRLKDLKERRDARQRDLAGKQERMSLFR